MANSATASASVGLPVFTLAFFTLLILKLTAYPAISWFWVFFPILFGVSWTIIWLVVLFVIIMFTD